MNQRSKHILRLALNDEKQDEILYSDHKSRTESPVTDSQMEQRRDSPLTAEQQVVIEEMENLGFTANLGDCPFSDKKQDETLYTEHNSRKGSPVTDSQMEQRRDSPLTAEQQVVIEEIENLGFTGNDNGIPLFADKPPLSVFITNNDFEQSELNVLSIEKQLTPLFTPIASVRSPLESPSILEPSENTPNPNLNNSVESFIHNSDDSVADPDFQPEYAEIQHSPVSSINPRQIEEFSLESNADGQEIKRHKRKAPESWKKSMRKKKRNSGETYTSTTGKIMPSKKCSNENCKCQLLCHTKIDSQSRENIHFAFWGLGNIERQRDYIVSNVLSTEANGRANNSRRKFTLRYSFTVNSQIIQVCQPFFLKTLDISDKMVRTALKKARRGVSNIPSPDKRGCHTPSNKLNEDDMKLANDHIDSFPKVPSHWCRKDTKKIYLETSLNKEKMYELYKQHCLEKRKNPIGKTSYKEVVLKKNIGFHQPRKDLCWCNKFEQLTDEEQEEKLEEYEEHINRKMFAQEEKKADKRKAISDSRVHVCTFDFQAVLYCPLVLGKPVFYKRKLGSMNFTIHDAATKQGFSYFWPEYEGNRGSNEVSTCLYDYITNLTDVDHLVLYSDCCPGQNRNSVVATMLSFVVASLNNNIRVIDYKFLEPGHTYMECDNMHGTIERASEYAKIFTPDDWQNVIRLARKDKPYNLKVMKHSNFLDFKKLKNSLVKATDGTTLQWANVKWLRVTKTHPDSLFFKNDYWEEFKEIHVRGKVTRAEHHSESCSLKRLYSQEISIKKAKHADLMSMCMDGTITKNYHSFYKNLPVATGSLPEPTPRQDDEDLELAATRASYLRRRSGKKN